MTAYFCLRFPNGQTIAGPHDRLCRLDDRVIARGDLHLGDRATMFLLALDHHPSPARAGTPPRAFPRALFVQHCPKELQ